MRISARNQIEGTIKSIESGAVNGTVKIAIDSDTIVTSNITMEAIAELKLVIGDTVIAIIKSSDVMIGKRA